MKRWTILLFTFICMTFLTSCSRVTTTTQVLLDSTKIEVVAPDKNVQLSKEDAKEINRVIENGRWIDDLGKCESDLQVVIGDRKLSYHSECGTFNDYEGKKSMTVSKKMKSQVNRIFEKYGQTGQVF
ncbi:MAG: hypothetical protein IJA67_09660 [Oscillospiraceae bacterium]|nr:hypothetical protein [Oscillospiraceae bacterium]